MMSNTFSSLILSRFRLIWSLYFFVAGVAFPTVVDSQVVSARSLPDIPARDTNSFIIPPLDTSCIVHSTTTDELKLCKLVIMDYKRRHELAKSELNSYCDSLLSLDLRVRQRPTDYGLSGLSVAYTNWAQELRSVQARLCASKSSIRASHRRAVKSFQDAISSCNKRKDKLEALQSAFDRTPNPRL